MPGSMGPRDGTVTAMPQPSSTPSFLVSPDEVVVGFLEALQAEDLDAALDLVADDLAYTNVSLPTLHGRGALERVFRPLLGRVGFRVAFHNVAADGGVVLTERTDALVFGPVTVQFWVWGRFEVVDGRIAVWRDSFDYGDMVVGLVRGLLGAWRPSLGRRWPG